MQLLHVVGTRPNIIKMAPLQRAITGVPHISQRLVHTGQHYDVDMSGIFFEELEIPEPDVNLNIGSGSHARQTAGVMEAFERVMVDYQPDIVVVVGDVNSTLACSLVAAKEHIPVAHVEAGLRSGDRRMPEEVNRIVTDQVSSLLFTPSRDAGDNLVGEGIQEERIHFVGNILIDSLQIALGVERPKSVLSRLELEREQYYLATLHRPSNVDDREQLNEILSALSELGSEYPVVFPMHPRTRDNVTRFCLEDKLDGITVVEPLGYLEMVHLLNGSRLVLTDSGGIQEETTALGVPCLTLRDTTERPITIKQGTNRLVLDRTKDNILSEARKGSMRESQRPDKWDGNTGERIARILTDVQGIREIARADYGR